MQPITIRAPHLTPDARAQVAGHAASWAASKAVELTRELAELAGAIAWLAERLEAGTADAPSVLRAIVGAEAELLVTARAARVYALAGGSCTPSWVNQRLAALEGAGR